MRTLLIGLCCLPLFAIAQAGRSEPTDSVRLLQLLHDYGHFDPYDSTDTWRSGSADTHGRQTDTLRSYRQRLEALGELSGQQAIDRELLAFVLDDDLYHLRFGSYRLPLNAEGGFLAGIVYRLGNRRVDSDEELGDYLSELHALPDYLAAQRGYLEAGLTARRTHPRLVVDRVGELIARTLAVDPRESLYLRPVARHPEWRDTVLATVSERVYPAYRAFGRFLAEDYAPQLPADSIGIGSIEGGRDHYRHLLRYFTTDDVSPEEVYATGQREVTRIRADMEAVIEEVGFTGTFAEFLEFLRTDPQFYASTPAALLERAAWITKRMEARLPEYFDRLPRMPLTVAPVPAALAPNYTGGRYSPGSYRDRRAGAFWVNTYDLPSRPLYTLPALALHEGVPGHHTQMMLSAELEGLSDFRRDLYLSAFGEGWALYCEYLGREAGIYETPYEEFGRLTYEMWRACRLVVDPGMHYFGWTRDEAVDFMTRNTALSLREVNSEIDRYIGWPGQAVSYKWGELKIRELRKLAEAELGDEFDLATFHSLVLANGAVTMQLLEQIVTDYITEQRK